MSCPTCGHRKPDGVPCGSPALRGKQFCYFHQRDLDRGHQRARIRRRAENLKLHFPPLETLTDVRVALFDVVDALAANCIEPQRAGALLFALAAGVAASPAAASGLNGAKYRRVESIFCAASVLYPITCAQFPAILMKPRNFEGGGRG